MMKILKPFTRVTNSTNFIPEIDGLRFFAIITVVMFHLNTSLSDAVGFTDHGVAALGGKNSMLEAGWWLVRMDLGVKVFFAISGMVLAIPFIKRSGEVSLKDYYLRRLTRLEPPFIISLTVFYFVHVLILNETWLGIIDNFLFGLIYSHVFVFGEPNPINPVTWSLETEAQFYLIFPLLFFLLNYRKVKSEKLKLILQILFCLVLLSLGSYFRSYFLTEHFDHLSRSVLAFLSNFSMGILFALVWLKYKKWFETKSWFWDVIGLFSLISLFYFYKPQASFWNNAIFNLSVLLMFFAIFKGRIHNFFYTIPLIYVIGGMCYSIYLLHYAFFHLVVPISILVLPETRYSLLLLLEALIVVPIALIVSAIFYRFFEKPFMNKNWPQQFRAYLTSRI